MELRIVLAAKWEYWIALNRWPRKLIWQTKSIVRALDNFVLEYMRSTIEILVQRISFFFSFSCWIYFYFYTKNCRICNMCIFPLSCPFSMIFLVPFSLYWNFITVDWYTIGFKMFRISVPRFNGSTTRSDLERSRYIFDL